MALIAAHLNAGAILVVTVVLGIVYPFSHPRQDLFKDKSVLNEFNQPKPSACYC